jgi:hypothetical protein
MYRTQALTPSEWFNYLPPTPRKGLISLWIDERQKWIQVPAVQEVVVVYDHLQEVVVE